MPSLSIQWPVPPPADVPALPKFLKRCDACGFEHDRAAWERLPLRRYEPKGDLVAGEILELRQCRCGSTLAVDLGDEPDR
jgi:hypothetical protein